MTDKKKSTHHREEAFEPTGSQSDMYIRNPGLLRELSSARITSGLPYQRPIQPHRVHWLLQNWDDRLVEPPIVSFRDGRYNLIDGQHRLTAMQIKNNGNHVIVVCRIYTGLTYADEAALCVLIDRADRPMSMGQAVNAKLESGTDAKLNDIKRLTKYEGFYWPVSKKHNSTYEIVANRALISAYDLLGPGSFYQMLRLLKLTWAGEPESLNAMMISGLALFLKTYESEITEATFVQKLSAVTPLEITNRAKADFSTNSNALRCARVILEKYNRNRGGKKLTYRFNK